MQSVYNSERYYTGITENLEKRLEEHNTGKFIHTNKFKPWNIKTYIAFSDIEKAAEFEKFLKTGNGRIFVKKRL